MCQLGGVEGLEQELSRAEWEGAGGLWSDSGAASLRRRNLEAARPWHGHHRGLGGTQAVEQKSRPWLGVGLQQGCGVDGAQHREQVLEGDKAASPGCRPSQQPKEEELAAPSRLGSQGRQDCG